MKETKTAQRYDRPLMPFDDEPANFGESSLCSSQSDLPERDFLSPARQGEVLLVILKRAFLFLPGALYLFFGTVFGLAMGIFQERPLSFLIMFAIGSFMTILGIGDYRNPKHLAIPLSIAAVGSTVFLLFFMLDQLKYLIDYGIYFFPAALIASVLARDTIDRDQSRED